MSMTGAENVTGWIMPNFFFHVTTAYAILRHNGVNLGKRDFLGAVPLRPDTGKPRNQAEGWTASSSSRCRIRSASSMKALVKLFLASCHSSMSVKPSASWIAAKFSFT